MKRILLILIILSSITFANQQNIKSFLHLGSIQIPVSNSNNDFADLLEFNHLDKNNWNPNSEDFVEINKSKKLYWKVVNQENLEINNDSKFLKIDYFGFYIKADQFNEVTIKAKSNSYLAIIVNNEIKVSKKKFSDGLDSVKTKLNIEPGKKFVLLKVLTPPEQNANLSVITESKYNLDLSVNNKRVTIVEDLLNNPKISGVDISHDGKYAIVKISKRTTDKKSSDNFIEVYDLKTRKLISDFSGGMKINSAEWHPQKNIISYNVNNSSASSIWLYDFDLRTNKLFKENIEDLGSVTWSPNGDYLIYSITEKYKEDESGLKKYTSINDRWPYNKNKTKYYKVDYLSAFTSQILNDEDSPSINSISNDGTFLVYSKGKVDLKERPYSKTTFYKLNMADLTKDSLFTIAFSGSTNISPDNKNVLVTASPRAFDGIGLNVDDGLIPNDYDTQAYIYNLETKKVEAITKEFNPQIGSNIWADANTLYFKVTDESYKRLFKYDLASKLFTKIPISQENIDNIDFSNDSKIAVYEGSSSTELSKVYTLDLATNKTELLLDVDPNYENIKMGEVKDWDFTSSQGRNIKGRIYFPPNFDESKTYPVIVNYYGGTSPTTREFEGRYPKNIWAANGYIVYVLQPSGATGFGQTFSAYHVNDWGTTTADEIIEGTKKFLAEHKYADSKRVGCIGASYGGFMTMTLLTKTDMFAAAISHAGISTLTSYWGEGYWGYSYSGVATAESFPWNRKDIYIDKSPIYSADKIKTPLLLLHGKSDTNVPVGESLTMFTALKLLGRDVEFVQVEGQDHWIMDYDKRMKWSKTIIAYYDRYLKDQPDWWNNLYPEKITD